MGAKQTQTRTRASKPFPSRFHGTCPMVDCPNDHKIVPGQMIAKLEVPKRRMVVNAESYYGYHYQKLKYACVECTEPPQPEPEPEYQEPTCSHCGATMLVDGEVLLRCPEGCGYE